LTSIHIMMKMIKKESKIKRKFCQKIASVRKIFVNKKKNF